MRPTTSVRLATILSRATAIALRTDLLRPTTAIDTNPVAAASLAANPTAARTVESTSTEEIKDDDPSAPKMALVNTARGRSLGGSS